MNMVAVIMATSVGAVAGGALVAWLTTRSSRGEPTDPSVAAVVHREIDRARRYERCVALIRIEVLRSLDGADPGQILERMTPALRSMDYAWAEGTEVNVLLPEVGQAGAEICVSRLEKALGDTFTYRVVVFPDDAVTEGALAMRLGGTADVLPAPHDLPRGSATAVRSAGPGAKRVS